ncbi:MAG: thioredoxin family protein [Candidatus Aenigmatarchaeota archaeon]
MAIIRIEVFGPSPPCTRCKMLKNIAENVAKKLKTEGIEVKVFHSNITSQETIKKYGILVSPALAINGIVRFMGRLPTESEIEKEIKK